MRIPNKPHFGVFSKTSTYVEGDQRSRDYPGHGYPAHYVEGVDYRSFENEAEMIEYYKQNIDKYDKVYVKVEVLKPKVDVSFS